MDQHLHPRTILADAGGDDHGLEAGAVVDALADQVRVQVKIGEAALSLPS